MKTIVAFLVVATAAHAAEPKVHRGLPYAEPAGEQQTLDVYAPTEGKNLPVVVWIHGGGGTEGTKPMSITNRRRLWTGACVFISIKEPERNECPI